MSGETSKKRGQFGEDVVERLLNLIGWQNLLSGSEIECFKGELHSISTKDRKDHGIDFIFQYDCPLFNDTQMFTLISSKLNDKYPSSPNRRLKSHIRDLANALDCFKTSTIRSKLRNSNATYSHKQTGVLFWIDNESEYDDLLERTSEFKIDDDLEFDCIYIVDNRRAGFLFDSILFSKYHFKGSVIEFVHPSTGYNVTAKQRLTSSGVLPVEYINTSILPLKVINNEEEYLILNSIDEFEEDYFKRLLSLSQKLTENWGQKIFILFPEFNKDRLQSIVDEAKLGLKDQRFAKKILVSSFKPNFRNIEQFY